MRRPPVNGRTSHPEYKVWCSARRHAAKRGIPFCQDWDDFMQFLKDMGPRPTESHRIDRVETASGYLPGNCRWALDGDRKRGRVRVDISGHIFGRLTALRPTHAGKHGRLVWLCRCSCGREHTVSLQHLRTGVVLSCGCLGRENTAARNTTHGLARPGRRHSLYSTWLKMKERCGNPRSADYKHYGARGIGVCQRWALSFPTFLEDVGERPSRQHTLDRKNNAGNYAPGNVIWSTQKEQTRNTRRNRIISAFGKAQCVAAWAEELGVSGGAIHDRLRRGLRGADALAITADQPRLVRK